MIHQEESCNLQEKRQLRFVEIDFADYSVQEVRAVSALIEKY